MGRGSDFRPETPPNPYNIDLIHFMFIRRHNKQKNQEKHDFYVNLHLLHVPIPDYHLVEAKFKGIHPEKGRPGMFE